MTSNDWKWGLKWWIGLALNGGFSLSRKLQLKIIEFITLL